MTADLPDFMLARITEDEEAARAAAGLTDGRWSKPDEWTSRAASAGMNPRQVEHLVRHDPARVLAECQAKRGIVEWCSERTRVFVGRLGDDPTDPANYIPGDYAHQDDSPVLRLLALPYADHPDYCEEWRP